LFETDADGEIASFTIRLEPAVAPIRFKRQANGSRQDAQL